MQELCLLTCSRLFLHVLSASDLFSPVLFVLIYNLDLLVPTLTCSYMKLNVLACSYMFFLLLTCFQRFYSFFCIQFGSARTNSDVFLHEINCSRVFLYVLAS